MSKTWETYEEVAQDLIQEFREHFNLANMERKQRFAGATGTKWELDGKGARSGDGAIVVLECRRRTSSAISQEQVAGLAYRIADLGGVGGILVSPLGFQHGAKLVAAAENIVEVTLSPDATTTEYMLRFLNRIHLGFEDRLGTVTDAIGLVLRDARTGEILKTVGDSEIAEAAEKSDRDGSQT